MAHNVAFHTNEELDRAARVSEAAQSLRAVDDRLDGSAESWRRGFRLRRVFVVGDIAALLGAYGILLLVGSIANRGDDTQLPVFLILVPLWIWLASLAGLYHQSERRLDQSFVDELGPVAMVTTGWAWCALITAAAVTSDVTPLFGPIIIWATTIPAVLVARAMGRWIASNSAWFRQPVLVIGDTGDVDRVLRRVLRHPDLGLDPIASLRKGPHGFVLEHMNAEGVRRVDSKWDRGIELDTSDVEALVSEAGIGRVMITGWSEGLEERTELIRVLAENDVCVDYVSGEPEALCATGVLNHIEGLPILTIRMSSARVTRSLKRLIDLVVAGMALTVLSPVLAYAAIRIKVGSSGPILFRQTRVGMDGRPFEVLKLRTMVDGADDLRGGMRPDADADGPVELFKLEADPRITPEGAWLRRWSIDELPQLWNVLRGDMSLVGPRPLPLDEAHLADGHFAERLRMRPGMTGPWQINGRSDIPFEDMVKLDYVYVASWTLLEDMRLLARTVGAVARGRGAY